MKVRLEIFEGPLDLLLYLIKKNHINIYDIPIAEIVEQYMEFLDLMKMLDINIAGEYLVILAELLKIKSQMLLPSPQQEEEVVEDPRQELVRKLIEYQKFKEAANFLRERETSISKYFTRRGEEIVEDELYLEVSIFDLINAFKATLKEIPKDVFFEVIKDEFTIEEKIHDLLHLLLERDKVSLEELFSRAKNKLEIVVTFLAILELIKLREIIAVQDRLFGPILIMRRNLSSSYV